MLPVPTVRTRILYIGSGAGHTWHIRYDVCGCLNAFTHTGFKELPWGLDCESSCTIIQRMVAKKPSA